MISTQIFSAILAGFFLGQGIVHADEPFKDYPGSVPLKFERPPASDLLHDGKVLLPDEARKLFLSGQIADLSLLNPRQDTTIWKDDFPSQKNARLDDLGLKLAGEEVEYISESEAPVGRMTFLVGKRNEQGAIRSFQIVLDVQSHNVLARKELLRKIGYQVPAIARIKNLKVKFKGAFSKKEFVREIGRQTFLESDRWVTAGADTDDGILELQDVLAFEGPNDPFYNLARGDMPGSIIRGRRLLNALLVPYALSDAPESLNLYGWVTGRIFNNQLILTYEDSEAFTTSYEDARWILRRILKLTRKDWEDVGAAMDIPYEPQVLMVEKMISRRNELRKLLHLTGESQEIPVSTSIGVGEHLRDGKLTKTDVWAGYARKFAAVDPDSPLSASELFGFARSKAMSNLIMNGITEFNTRFMPKTDLAMAFFDRSLTNAAKQFAHFIKTGEKKAVPFAVWATPIYNGNMILSREVVTGYYLGAENIIQTADTFGMAWDLGALVAFDALPARLGATGQVKASLLRTYTRLKPTNSIKASLKEPIKNIFVPGYLWGESSVFTRMLKLEKAKKDKKPEDFEKELETLFKEFNTSLGVGESIIIQSSIAPTVDFRASYGLREMVDLYGRFQNQLMLLSRLNVVRKSDGVVQVYRDPSMYNVMNLSLGVRAAIQALEIGWTWKTGAVNTEFFELNINPKPDENPDFFRNMAKLREIFRSGRTHLLKEGAKPWKLKHRFSEQSNRFDFLWFRSLNAKSYDEVKVSNPEGMGREFIRRTRGQRTGQDFESLVFKGLNFLIDELTDAPSSVNVASTNTGNPGETVKGTSVTKQFIFEGEVPEGETFVDTDTMYIGMDYRWRGWSASPDKIQKIVKDIEKRMGKPMFQRELFLHTKSLQFYSIELKVGLYREALETLAALDPKILPAVYQKFGVLQMSSSTKVFIDSYIQQGTYILAEIAKAKMKEEEKKYSDSLLKLVQLLDSTLTPRGFQTLIGGEDKLFARATVRGFRDGAAEGQQDLISHTIGEIGSLKPYGPLRDLGDRLGIPEGQLFIYWLMNRL